MTAASAQALSVLRNTDNMQWYIVPLLVSVFYIYFVEIEKKNWGVIFLGLAFWANEFIYEIGNALLLRITDYAPLWITPGKSSYVIYVGLTVEICFFFAVFGLMALKIMPEDKKMKILGIPNRVFIPCVLGLSGLFVEVILNQCNMLIWEYKFWSWPNLYLLAIGYCAPLLMLVWLHDNLSLSAKRNLMIIVSATAIALHILFAVILKWI